MYHNKHHPLYHRLSLMRTMRKNHVLIVHERVKKIKIDKAEAEVRVCVCVWMHGYGNGYGYGYMYVYFYVLYLCQDQC